MTSPGPSRLRSATLGGLLVAAVLVATLSACGGGAQPEAVGPVESQGLGIALNRVPAGFQVSPSSGPEIVLVRDNGSRLTIAERAVDQAFTLLDLAKEKGIVVQKNSAPDAKYVAFLRTHRGNKQRSAITHIAEVEHTESHVPRKVSYAGFPELIEHSQKRGHSLDGTHKHYVLGEIIPLAKEIPHLKGEGSKSQVYFQTKLSELIRVDSVGKIRTLGKLG